MRAPSSAGECDAVTHRLFGELAAVDRHEQVGVHGNLQTDGRTLGARACADLTQVKAAQIAVHQPHWRGAAPESPGDAGWNGRAATTTSISLAARRHASLPPRFLFQPSIPPAGPRQAAATLIAPTGHGPAQSPQRVQRDRSSTGCAMPPGVGRKRRAPVSQASPHSRHSTPRRARHADEIATATPCSAASLRRPPRKARRAASIVSLHLGRRRGVGRTIARRWRLGGAHLGRADVLLDRRQRVRDALVAVDAGLPLVERDLVRAAERRFCSA